MAFTTFLQQKFKFKTEVSRNKRTIICMGKVFISPELRVSLESMVCQKDEPVSNASDLPAFQQK